MTSQTWHLVISGRESEKVMCRSMLPYAVKKRAELQAVLAYLNNQIPGLQFIEIVKGQVRTGQRTGKLRPQGPPFTSRIAAKIGQGNGIRKRNAKLSR